MVADTESAAFVMQAEQQQRYFELGAQPEEAASYLAEVLQLPEHKHHARSAIKLDYVTHVLELAKQLQLQPCKAAVLLGIAQGLLELCSAGGTFEQAQALLRSQVMERCAARPAPDDEGLAPDQIARFAQFFAQSLFQHYALYSHVMCCEQEHTAYTAELLVETARVPTSFEDVLTEAEWEAANAARAEQQEQERLAAAAAVQAAYERELQEQEELRRQQEEQARHEELTKKPKTLDEAVEQLVALRLEDERQQLAQQYAAKEAELMARLAALEGPGSAAKAAAKKC